MLSVLEKPKITEPRKIKVPDTIVTRTIEKIIENEDGTTTIKREAELVNLSKKINETKKLIKKGIAEQKLEEIERIAKM